MDGRTDGCMDGRIVVTTCKLWHGFVDDTLRVKQVNRSTIQTLSNKLQSNNSPKLINLSFDIYHKYQ